MIYSDTELQEAYDTEQNLLLELERWLIGQPQDVWLMLVKTLNHDMMKPVVEHVMIDNLDCDLAVIARYFWGLAPSYYVEKNPDWTGRDEHIRQIVSNLNRGYYRRQELGFNRFEILDEVQAFAAAAARRCSNHDDFDELPRELLGPFPGRQPDVTSVRANELDHINSMIGALGGSSLFLQNEEWQQTYESNYWLRHYLRLPEIAKAPDTDILLEEIEGLYGAHDAYLKARRRLGEDMPYLGKQKPASLLGQLRWATRDLRGNAQFFEGF